MAGELSELTPPQLSAEDRQNVFDYFFRRLTAYRNTVELYALAEFNGNLSILPEQALERKASFSLEVNRWAQGLLRDAWHICQTSVTSEDSCPELDPLADTSTRGLRNLPPPEQLSRVFTAVLFLHVTSTQQYSARTRAFLLDFCSINEAALVSVLKHPDQAIETARRQTQIARRTHAENGRALRMLGMGLGAVAGGVLIGVTGGLAAPLVGAGVTTVLGWLGVGGTVAGLLAGGLASSSVVCGALFGVYGAKSTADMVGRHVREVRDLAIIPVRCTNSTESMAVRLCISGWLRSPQDITAPWNVFGGEDTFALQWEVEALQTLSNAIITLLQTQAMRYIKGQVIKRTIFAGLMSALSPTLWLSIGKIIDNPWMNARALAIKTGAILGSLLSSRVFGNRPVILCGYSLGSLVIFEALKYLSTLPCSETTHMVQDVFLFGTPATSDPAIWSAIRRVVGGRLINGYSQRDYVLAVLSRLSDTSWNVAGLQSVEVMGVENVECAEVDGHLQWQSRIGKCLEDCGASGIIPSEVELQMEVIGDSIEKDVAGPNPNS